MAGARAGLRGPGHPGAQVRSASTARSAGGWAEDLWRPCRTLSGTDTLRNPDVHDGQENPRVALELGGDDRRSRQRQPPFISTTAQPNIIGSGATTSQAAARPPLQTPGWSLGES